jgi:hypothetical protein
MSFSLRAKLAHKIVRTSYRWYAIVEGNKFEKNIKMSRNQQIVCLHMENATQWLSNTNHRVVHGDTLIFDFIFFLHPTAIGHWWAPTPSPLSPRVDVFVLCLHCLCCVR